MRVVTAPRAGIVETRPFDAAHLVPGIDWEEESTMGELGIGDVHVE